MCLTSLLFYISQGTFSDICINLSIDKCVWKACCMLSTEGELIKARSMVGRLVYCGDAFSYDFLPMPLQARSQAYKDSLKEEENQKLQKMKEEQHQKVFTIPC